ncbi:hypothetical protein V6N13_038507 [Hibiscus sabdariffa]
MYGGEWTHRLFYNEFTDARMVVNTASMIQSEFSMATTRAPRLPHMNQPSRWKKLVVGKIKINVETAFQHRCGYDRSHFPGL